MEFITEADRFVFGEGNHYEIYNKLGAHLTEIDGVKGVHFAVWAPNAKAVSVVGDFNGWDVNAYYMNPLGTSGIWAAFIPGVEKWAMYKYAIRTGDGRILYKADPYAFHSELRPGTASKVADIDGFRWSDEKWLKAQEEDPMEKPMAIYEIHPGSWKKDYSRGEDGFMDYKSIADKLVPYIKEMGYTHIELMGIAEHPFDGSWGYQVTGYYAPTSRYGGPEEFMYFVNEMHKNNIGVILDWVPAHFPKDACGLAEFDGTCLYEYADPRKGEHADWGTKIFNYEKNEVKNFLIANALFWVEKYHIDALRVDAVASMLYLDYGRTAGNWVPNIYGDNKNLEAIEFLKHLNSIMKKRVKRAYLIAEESTAYPMVTGDVENGSLGFQFKWNMGWMNDFLEYLKLDPLFKKGNHNKITFSITYAASENYILVLSHDEVVHLKCSMINKMPGFWVDKFANLKAAYTFMFGHPGKKLLFMGQEFAMVHEWDEKKEIEWYLLKEPLHYEMQQYVKSLLQLYRTHPVLYKYEKDYRSFEWVNADDADRSIYSFIRKNPDDYKGALLFICNFTPVERTDYCVGVPKAGTYKQILTNFSVTKEDETMEEYEARMKAEEEARAKVKVKASTRKDRRRAKNKAMQVVDNTVKYKAVGEECDGLPYRLNIPLKPFEAMVIEF